MARSTAGVLQAGVPGPRPTTVNTPARPAAPCGVDRRRRFGDGACRTRGLRLGDPQHARVTGRGERRRLRDPVAAHFPEHHVGRVGEPRCEGFERGRIEEPHRQPEGSAQRMHGRLVRLDVDREDPRQRMHGQAGACKRALDQTFELARRSAALATHPQRESPPVEHQGVFVTGIRGIGHPHRERRVGYPSRERRIGYPSREWCVGSELDPRTLQPLGLPLDTARFSGQQPGHERLVVMRVREHPPRRWVVQRDLPAGLAGGGDRGRHAQRLSHSTAERVGAAVAAEQRHDRAAVLRHGDDRRLLALVGEHRRQGPDQDTGGAHPHDVGPIGEQSAHLDSDILEPNVGVRRPRGISVYPRTGVRHSLIRRAVTRPRSVSTRIAAVSDMSSIASLGRRQAGYRAGHRTASPRTPHGIAPRRTPHGIAPYRMPRGAVVSPLEPSLVRGPPGSAGILPAWAGGPRMNGPPKAHPTFRRARSPRSPERHHMPRRAQARLRQDHVRHRVTHSTHRRGHGAGSSRSTARCPRRPRQAAGASRSPWSHARRSGRSRSDPSPR